MSFHPLPPAWTQAANDNDNMNAHASDADSEVGVMKSTHVNGSGSMFFAWHEDVVSFLFLSSLFIPSNCKLLFHTRQVAVCSLMKQHCYKQKFQLLCRDCIGVGWEAPCSIFNQHNG